MTRLLVSVRDASEAAEALAAGAHLIDVKEPRRGALGRAEASTIADVLRTVGNRVPVSAALGELEALRFDPKSASLDQLPAGLAFAKIGLAHMAADRHWPERWRNHLDRMPSGVRRVAVAYADWELSGAPHPLAVLEAGRAFGCAAILVETFDKSHGGLFATASDDLLAKLVATAKSAKMLSLLAGSVTGETLARAAAHSPDFVAVRGAACVGARTDKISGLRIRRLLEVLENAGKDAVFSPRRAAGEISNSVA